MLSNGSAIDGVMKLSRSDTILLHLYKSMKSKDRWALTQYGISKATGIDRTYVSKLLKALLSKGLVEERKERLAGVKRKINVYILTFLGLERVRTLLGANTDEESEDEDHIKLGGKINYIFDENNAFQIVSDIAKANDRIMVVTIRNPELLRSRYGLDAIYVWLTYLDHPNGVSPDRIDFELDLAIEKFARGGGRYLVFQGIEYLMEKHGVEKIEEYLRSVSSRHEHLILIIATNNPGLPIKEICDWFMEKSTAIRDARFKIVDEIRPSMCSLVITSRGREEARIYGQARILSLKDDITPEGLLFEGLEMLSKTDACAVHIDCADFIIRHLGNRAIDFFKDAMDLLSLKNAKLEVKRSVHLMNSYIKFLFEDIGLGHNTVFVDRKEEFDFLKNVAREVSMGMGRTVFVIGPLGVGKTFLVQEFAKYAILRGFRVYQGRAYPIYSEPYLPYKEAFGEELYDYFRSINHHEDGRQEQRNAMFYDIARWIHKLSEKAPVLVHIDDAQWMDSSSLSLMVYLSSKLQNSRVMFIYTYRSDEMKKEIKEVMTTLERTESYRKLKIHPFGWKEIRDQITTLLETKTVPDSFVDAIFSRTLGNPLFVRELVKKLVEDGMIDPDKGKYEIENNVVPEIIRDIYERKFLNLDDEERRIIEIAAVYGKEIPMEILIEITRLDYLDFAEKFEKLNQLGIMVESSRESHFALAHPIIGDIVYQRIPKVKRRALHLKIAESIEKIYSDGLFRFYSELAYHYGEAKIKDKALKYNLLMGDIAFKNYAYEQALRHYAQALKIKDTGEVHEKIGDVKRIIGNYNEAVIEYKKALKLYVDVEKKVKVLTKLSRTLESEGKFIDALRYVDEAVGICNERGDISDACLDALGVSGWIHMRMGNYWEAEKIFTRILTIATERGSKKILSDANHYMGTLMMYSGKYDQAVEYFKRALSICREVDEMRCVSTLNNLGLTYKKMGAYEEALRYYMNSLKLSKKMGFESGIATSLVNMGIIYKKMGKLEQAADAYLQGLEIAKRIDDKYLLSAIHTNLGSIYFVLGDLERARNYIRESVNIKEEIGDLHGSLIALCILGDILREMGNFDDAIKIHKSVLVKAADARNTEALLQAAISLGDDYLLAGKIVPTDILDMLRKFEKENISPATKAEISRIVGMNKIFAGDSSAGMMYVQRGKAEMEGSKNFVDLAIYNLRCGKLLMRVDNEEAKKYLKEAAEIFKKFDMKKRYEEVLSVLNV